MLLLRPQPQAGGQPCGWLVVSGAGCGQPHPEDCLCDLKVPAAPVAPARNVQAAIVEIAMAWGTESIPVCDQLHAGRSYATVARETGLTPDVVRHRARRMGLASKRAGGGGNLYTPEQYGAVLARRGEGLSYTAVASATGVPRNAVIGICRRRRLA